MVVKCRLASASGGRLAPRGRADETQADDDDDDDDDDANDYDGDNEKYSRMNHSKSPLGKSVSVYIMRNPEVQHCCSTKKPSKRAFFAERDAMQVPGILVMVMVVVVICDGDDDDDGGDDIVKGAKSPATARP